MFREKTTKPDLLLYDVIYLFSYEVHCILDAERFIEFSDDSKPTSLWSGDAWTDLILSKDQAFAYVISM